MFVKCRKEVKISKPASPMLIKAEADPDTPVWLLSDIFKARQPQ